MAGRQKSREAVNLKRAAISREAQEFFQFRLSCVDTIQEAKQLARQEATQSEISRRYYANLMTFLNSEFKQLPPLVSRFEKQLYLELIGRFAARGELQDSARAAIEALLNSPTPKAAARTMADRVARK